MNFYGRVLFAVAILFLSSFPYLYGLVRTPEGTTYSGIRPINASDYNQHLSFIQQCREGKFLLQNLYTSLPHDPYLVRPVYYILSLPFGLTELPNTVVFHILRVLCGFLLLCLLIPLAAVFVKDKNVSVIATVLVAVSGGVGVFFSGWIQPVESGIPEATLFMSLGEAPHFLFSLLLLWSGIAGYYLAVQDKRKGMLLYLVCLLVLWWEHPFEAVILIFVASAAFWMLPRWMDRVILFAGIGIVSLPPYLYYQRMKQLEAFAGWASEQNLMLSPSPLSYIAAFLPLILFALYGIRLLIKDPNTKTMLLFLGLWIITQFVLVYLPFPFQRRLIAGVQFPLALLAAFGVAQLRKPGFIAGAILLMAAGNLPIVIQQTRIIHQGGMPYYLPDSYSETFRWLKNNAHEDGILAGHVTGNFIPGYTGAAVHMGHSSFTPEIERRRAEAWQFFRNPNPEFLKQNNLQTVFVGLEEKNNGANTGALDRFLHRVYENGPILIYRP